MAAIVISLATATSASAGVYYSGDQCQPLPVSWRGYLPDQRLLRNCATQADAGKNPLRDRYADDALALEATAKSTALKADQIADLGALYVRLGTCEKAVALLRPARKAHPKHFRIAANLGTACQLIGELDSATGALLDAVDLAPAECKANEELHLLLVVKRAKEKASGIVPDAVDDLFGVRYVGESGKAEAGAIAAAQRKLLPNDSLAKLQQLAAWLPADPRLLWQLAEHANADGDVRTAANILDGLVTEFGFQSAEARARRQLYRSAADALAKDGKHDTSTTRRTDSPRLFVRILDETKLPRIDADRVNALPWAALAETTIGKKFEVTPLKYIDQLDGKMVTATGFVVPTGTDSATEFLFVEFPVGCWFCESPGQTRTLAVRLAEGDSFMFARGPHTVVGKLEVNRKDPEGYLFIVTGAIIKAAD